jgi:HEAT repeat protein
MATTSNDVRRLLASDEPNYAAAAKLGPAILPQLAQLVTGSNPDLAAKAAFLAGMIHHNKAVAVLQRAAKSASPDVRLAAAGAARSMKQPAVSGVLLTLLGDRDAGVRKFAIKAAASRSNSALTAKVRDLSQKDPEASNRALAQRATGKPRPSVA